MTDEARIDAGTAAYRGFLFSDMRGFTAFAERHGNAAAAAAVSRFLEIARKAIARHQGAEIKTEGDAIHAVFPSASSAVMCGLEIVDSAAELNTREPDQPLGLGVGIHAGEAVETAEGYIGSAVNLAARVCSVAQPGEVLVTSTVKGITQASIPVGFIARGRRRLKGITEPVDVYAVTRDRTAAARAVPPVVAVGAVLGAVVLFAIAAIVTLLAPANPAATQAGQASPSSPATPTAQPVVMGPLPVGTYTPRQFQPSFTFTIADPGWTATRDLPDMVGLIREVAPRGSVFFARIQEVFVDPCVVGGEGATGPGESDVIAQLETLGHVALSNEQTAQVGGFSGRQVDVTIADGALAACGGLVGAEVALFGVAEEVWSASPGELFRLVTFDVGEQPVTVLLSTDWTQTQSVQELEDLWRLGEGVLDGVEFSEG